MAKNVLLGVKKFNAKSGKSYVVMTLVSEFDERSVQSGCFGKSIEEIFVPEAMMGRLTASDVGKEIVLDYEVKSGRAYLIGFDVKK